MPSLTLSNQLSANLNQWHGTTTAYSEDFDSDDGGFNASGTNASISHDSENGLIVVEADASPGWAWKPIDISPYTTYNYSAILAATQLGGGHFNIGTHAISAPSDLLNRETTSATTYTGTFTTGNNFIVYISLQTDLDTKILKWNDISITETR